MIILHITPSTKGYEVVKLLANAVNRTNGLAVIQKDDGEIYYTGGLLINNTPEIRAVLDAMPKEKQYNFAHSFQVRPFAQLYYE